MRKVKNSQNVFYQFKRHEDNGIDIYPYYYNLVCLIDNTIKYLIRDVS